MVTSLFILIVKIVELTVSPRNTKLKQTPFRKRFCYFLLDRRQETQLSHSEVSVQIFTNSILTSNNSKRRLYFDFPGRGFFLNKALWHIVLLSKERVYLTHILSKLSLFIFPKASLHGKSQNQNYLLVNSLQVLNSLLAKLMHQHKCLLHCWSVSLRKHPKQRHQTFPIKHTLS